MLDTPISNLTTNAARRNHFGPVYIRFTCSKTQINGGHGSFKEDLAFEEVLSWFYFCVPDRISRRCCAVYKS